MHQLHVEFDARYPSAELTVEECELIADTFCHLGEVFHGGAQLEVSGFVQGIESVTQLARVERVELAVLAAVCVPIASATPTAPAAGSMLVGKTIYIRIELKEYLRATATSTENMHQLHVEFDAQYPDELTAEECQQIADTFWSGTGPEFQKA